jgi:hypothetical protein
VKPVSTRERDARLPVLQRSQADAGLRRQVPLDQASPTAMAQE